MFDISSETSVPSIYRGKAGKVRSNDDSFLGSMASLNRTFDITFSLAESLQIMNLSGAGIYTGIVDSPLNLHIIAKGLEIVDASIQDSHFVKDGIMDPLQQA